MKPTEALKILAKKNRDLEQRVARLEQVVSTLVDDDEWNLDDPDLILDTERQSEGDDLSGLDPEEVAQVLAARERLKNESGQSISQERFGVEPNIVESKDGITIEVPPPTDKQKEQREKFAPRLGLEHLAADENVEKDELVKGWVLGGPIWLHGYNRDFVMGLPKDVRQAFVNDVEQHSPTWAQELGRDILKDDGPGEPSLTIDSILARTG